MEEEMMNDFIEADTRKRRKNLTPQQLKLIVKCAEKAQLDVWMVVDWVEYGKITVSDVMWGILGKPISALNQ